MYALRMRLLYFNPHPLWRGRPVSRTSSLSKDFDFNPHPLWRGRPIKNLWHMNSNMISIHTLCEEGDTDKLIPYANNAHFNPHPLWRGRHIRTCKNRRKTRFQSTPSVKRATLTRVNVQQFFLTFQSTPSVKRATPVQCQMFRFQISISIHTLCEEGDGSTAFRVCQSFYFNPHPLWRGRQKTRNVQNISSEFQSTPSVKRATV